MLAALRSCLVGSPMVATAAPARRTAGAWSLWGVLLGSCYLGLGTWQRHHNWQTRCGWKQLETTLALKILKTSLIITAVISLWETPNGLLWWALRYLEILWTYLECAFWPISWAPDHSRSSGARGVPLWVANHGVLSCVLWGKPIGRAGWGEESNVLPVGVVRNGWKWRITAYEIWMCNNDERCVGAMLHVYGINMKERASALWSPWLLMKGDLVLITSEIVSCLTRPVFFGLNHFTIRLCHPVPRSTLGCFSWSHLCQRSGERCTNNRQITIDLIIMFFVFLSWSQVQQPFCFWLQWFLRVSV